MRLWAAGAMFVAVLTVDTVSKAFAPHSGWTWHDHPFDDPGTANLAQSLLTVAVGVWLVTAFRSIGIAVAIAGVVGNTSWAFLTGGTPNPLVDTTLSIPGDDGRVQRRGRRDPGRRDVGGGGDLVRDRGDGGCVALAVGAILRVPLNEERPRARKGGREPGAVTLIDSHRAGRIDVADTTTPDVRSDIGPFSMMPEWLLDTDVTANGIRVFATLALYSDRHTRKARPSRATLARRCGCSPDTIDRALKDLQRVGAVEVEARYEEGSVERKANSYSLHFARPGSRESAATPSREDAATGSRKDAAENQNHREPEPLEPETTATAVAVEPVYDPLKGRRVDGRDLPWDALADATKAFGEANGPVMKRALNSIRKDVVAEFGEDPIGEYVRRRGGRSSRRRSPQRSSSGRRG